MSAPAPSNALPSAPLEVAIAQLNTQDDVEASLAAIDDLAKRAAQGGARVLALPEGSLTLGNVEKKRATAEPSPIVGTTPTEGRAMPRLAAIARANRLHLFAGGVALATDARERPNNAHVVFSDEGVVVAVYRKIHLFDVALVDGTKHQESDSTTAGAVDDVKLVDVHGWRFGLSICYDLRFPEHYRRLVDGGAHVLLVPSAFTVPTGKDHWHVLLRARAIESQCYLMAPAQWGKHPEGRATYGKSLVADPWGDVIAQASDGVGVVRATLDPKRIADVRAQLPALRHRRVR